MQFSTRVYLSHVKISACLYMEAHDSNVNSLNAFLDSFCDCHMTDADQGQTEGYQCNGPNWIYTGQQYQKAVFFFL